MTTSINISSKNKYIEVDNLQLAIKKKEDKIVVFSPAFKVLGYSNVSEEEALEDFRNSLTFFFIIHLEDGTLGRALTEFGWEPRITSINKPADFGYPKSIHTSKTQDFKIAVPA